MVTEATGWHDKPAEGLAVNATVPVNVPIPVTVTVDEPELVARILVGETAPNETLKSAPTETDTPAAPLTDLTSVVAAAAVPVTVIVKEAAGRGLQVTDIRPAVLTVAVHPAGCVEVTA
jgi:hypothetical protein